MARSEGAPAPERSAPSGWQRFFETSSGATLITVVVGGIFGTIITSMVQSMVETRAEARAQAREVVAARLEAVQAAFSIVGRMIGSAEELIVVAGPEYDTSRYEGSERARVVAEIHRILDDYNLVDRTWRVSKESHALLLAYYHPRETDVAPRWSELSAAVSGFVACARSWKVTHPEPTAYDGNCDDERQSVDAAIAVFARTIGAGDG